MDVEKWEKYQSRRTLIFFFKGSPAWHSVKISGLANWDSGTNALGNQRPAGCSRSGGPTDVKLELGQGTTQQG